MSLLHVGTLETGNDGDSQVHLIDKISNLDRKTSAWNFTHALDNLNKTLGDGVATNDTTEDVDEDGSDLGVAGDEIKGLLNGLRGGSTSDVQEVGGFASVELDNVHGGHGKTGTVDKASNVTSKLDEVQVGLGSLDLVGVLLSGVAPFENGLLPELCVVVKVELGVHAQNLVVRGLGKGVDLDLSGVLLHEDLVELLDGVNGIVDALGREAELGSDAASHLVSDTNVDVDGGGEDGFWGILGDGLNVHTTLRRGDNDGALGGSVHENGEVELSSGKLALDNVDGVADTAALASLLGDELVTNHLVGEDLSLLGTELG